MILKELESTKSGLLSYVQNPETGDRALDFVASMTSYGISFFQDLLKDDMKMTLANTFLLSQVKHLFKTSTIWVIIQNICHYSLGSTIDQLSQSCAIG